MRIVMAGASGFLGHHLCEHLVGGGHSVVQLVRREPTAPAQRRWRPERGELDPAVLAGAGAVVNLAGAGVQDKRWNDSYRRVLLTSRVDPTATLASALAALPVSDRPSVLINASAVGYYGDTGDVAVDEDSPAGQGFFPDLCRAWEAAAAPAAAAGVRVLHLRTGLVLDSRGGLLKPLVLIFRLGAGGRMGDGRQWMPWISLHDWISATTFLLDNAAIAGPVNLVGPAPARNVAFTRALARALRRPAIMPTPRWAIRLVLGAFGREVVASQRVLPGVLTRHGFTFRDADLNTALHAALH